jgi:predicted RNA-binding Zn-ribbon protein involved in translation (DUF1610 family)
MYSCPECNKEMIWQSDYEKENDTYSDYVCFDCEIELIKKWKCDTP